MIGVIERLWSVSWALPLVNTIEQRGGLTFSTKPLLFEARVALALVLAGIDPVHYEFPAGVGGEHRRLSIRLAAAMAGRSRQHRTQ